MTMTEDQDSIYIPEAAHDLPFAGGYTVTGDESAHAISIDGGLADGWSPYNRYLDGDKWTVKNVQRNYNLVSESINSEGFREYLDLVDELPDYGLNVINFHPLIAQDWPSSEDDADPQWLVVTDLVDDLRFSDALSGDFLNRPRDGAMLRDWLSSVVGYYEQKVISSEPIITGLADPRMYAWSEGEAPVLVELEGYFVSPTKRLQIASYQEELSLAMREIVATFNQIRTKVEDPFSVKQQIRDCAEVFIAAIEARGGYDGHAVDYINQSLQEDL